MGCEDDEIEVISKDSQLYSYLADNCEDSFEYYDNQHIVSCKGENIENKCTPQNTVSEQLWFMIDEILHSSLLLDEDASYLYEISSDVVPEKNNTMFKLAVINGFVALSASCFYLYYKESLYFSLPIVICTFCSSIYNGIDCLYYILWRKKLARLLKTLNNLHFYIRKISQYLNESSSCQTKYFIKQKSRTVPNSSLDNIIFERESVETLHKTLHKCLLDIIYIAKENTRKLIQVFPLNATIDCPSHYLAFSTSNQIGLSGYEDFEEFNPSAIDVLKNFYILSQSESLRRLGLCFCPTVWKTSCRQKNLSKVFDVVEEYTILNQNTLQFLEHKYKSFCSPKLFCRNNRKYDPKWLDGCNFLHKLSFSLHSLLFEVRMIEDYLELNEKDDEYLKISNTNIKLVEIGSQFQETVKSLQDATKYFRKMQNMSSHSSNSNDEVKEEVETSADPVVVRKTGIMVGYSDFTPSDSDRVYLCVTDSKIENCSEEEVFEETVRSEFPPSLLLELKGALLTKKKEFDERESEALKSNADYEKFLNYDINNDSNKDEPNKKSSMIFKELSPFNSEISIVNSEDQSSEGGSFFQKTLAANAVKKALEINTCHEEFFYGTESDTE